MPEQTIDSATVRNLPSGSITPNTPTVTAPSGTSVALTPTITTSAFSITNGDTHIVTQYQISLVSDFASTVYDVTNTNLTSHTVGGVLAMDTIHYVRVRHKANIGGFSGWSDVVQITTALIYIQTPTLTVTGSPSSVPETPTLTGDAFVCVNGADTHLNTDWQIFLDSMLVWSSMADASNKVTINVPATYLVVNTTYTFKVKYRGTTYGVSAYRQYDYTTLAMFGFGDLLLAYISSGVLEYSKSVDTFTYADYLSITPYARASCMSSDGTYLCTILNGDPGIKVYKRSGNTFSLLATPSPTGWPEGYAGMCCAFSPDGVYLACGANGSPYVLIYKRSGDTFTKLSDPATLPGGAINGISFDSDVSGTYLALNTNGSAANIILYKRSGDTFTKLSDPSSLPTGRGYDIKYFPNSTYLVHGGAVASPNAITIYKRSGDTHTKLTTLAMNGYCAGVFGISPDSIYLYIGAGSSPWLNVWKRSGDTFSVLSSCLSENPPSTVYSVRISKDGMYVMCGLAVSPYILIYKRSGDTFTKLSNISSNPPSAYVEPIDFYPSSLYGA